MKGGNANSSLPQKREKSCFKKNKKKTVRIKYFILIKVLVS